MLLTKYITNALMKIREEKLKQKVKEVRRWLGAHH
jgi:hypothetical protein